MHENKIRIMVILLQSAGRSNDYWQNFEHIRDKLGKSKAFG